MVWWQAALWGIAGGFLVEALELYASIRRSTRRWTWRRPIPQGMAAFVVSVVIRMGAGGTVAAALAQDGQVAGALAALGLGVAAPLVIEKLARVVPLNVDVQATMEPAPPAPAPPPSSGAPLPGSAGRPGGGTHAP
ncbi:hypothetical protein ACQPZP_36345 [Spirillospora sp. CA-142024]|uniref:hypothetical protein n=1 Tax=Spirillospora sp. CA-142024 TaxID=3240036 RepID=UPI003D9505E1